MGGDEASRYGGNGLDSGARMYADRANWFQNKYGRAPTPTELYLTNQQGQGGIAAHLSNPDAPAWQNMYSTGEGQQKGAGWAKKAIWGQRPHRYACSVPRWCRQPHVAAVHGPVETQGRTHTHDLRIRRYRKRSSIPGAVGHAEHGSKDFSNEPDGHALRHGAGHAGSAASDAAGYATASASPAAGPRRRSRHHWRHHAAYGDDGEWQ